MRLYLFIKKEQRVELHNHLIMNNYSVKWVTDNTIIISEDEASYIKTILDDRNITYLQMTDEDSARLLQCYEDSGNMWQYYDVELNPCGCGSNCYHFEYDITSNKIYGVCNCCNTDIYEVKGKYMEKILHTGKWVSK